MNILFTDFERVHGPSGYQWGLGMPFLQQFGGLNCAADVWTPLRLVKIDA